MAEESKVFAARIDLTGFKEDIQTMNTALTQVGRAAAAATPTAAGAAGVSNFQAWRQQQQQLTQTQNASTLATLQAMQAAGQLTAAQQQQLQALGLLTPATQAQTTAVTQLAGTQSMTAAQMQQASGIAQQMAGYMATAAQAQAQVGATAAAAVPPVTGMATAAQTAATGIAATGAAAQAAVPPITTLQQTTGGAGNSLTALGVAAGAAAAALVVAVGTLKIATAVLDQFGIAAGRAWEYVREATALAARVETLGVAVQVVGQNMGYTSTQVNEFEKSIVNMNITTQAARQGMLYMGEALIDFSKGSQLARIAQDAAIIGNINSSAAFERLVNAIQRGEPRMLRSIGISLSFERAYVREAAALGKTERQLTDYEKSQIRVNEVIRVGARLAGTYEAAYDTVGKKMTSLPRILEQVQLAVGNVLLKGWQEIFNFAFDGLERLQKILEDTANQPALKELQRAFQILAKDGVQGITNLTNELGRMIGLDFSTFQTALEGITKTILIMGMLPDIIKESTQENIQPGPIGRGVAGQAIDIAKIIGAPAIETFKLVDARILQTITGTDNLTDALKKLGITLPTVADGMDVAFGQKPQSAIERVRELFAQSLSDLMTMATGKSPLQRQMDGNLELLNKQSSENARLNATIRANQEEHNDNLLGIEAEYKQKFIDIDTDQADEMIKIDQDAARKREDIWQKYNEDVAKINVSYNQKIIDAQTKLNDDLLDAQQNYQQKQEDIQTDYQRTIADLATSNSQDRMEAERELTQDLLDMELDLSRKIEDIWTDFGRKVAEIQLKNAQDIADQGTAYERDLAELDRKNKDDDAAAAIAHANKMADIERDYQRKILQIKLDYAYDSEELIRQRDAIGFLARQRQLQRDLSAAQMSRSQSQGDEKEDAKRQEEERQKRIEEERRELAIKNQQKLDDLRLQYQRELDAATQNRDQALADAIKAGDQERVDRLLEYERDLADLQLKYDQEREAANLNRERDLADAQKAYVRARVEAQANYEQTIRDLQEAKARELAAANVAREQDLAAAAQARQRDIDDANVKYGIKRRDLIAARQKEIDSENQAWTAKRTIEVKNLQDSINNYYKYYKNLLDQRRHYNDSVANMHVVPPPEPDWNDVGAGTRSIGQGGQVTATLTSSMYSPPATPMRSGGGSWGGSRRLDIGIDVTGNVDAVTQSQLVRTVREVVQNALAA